MSEMESKDAGGASQLLQRKVQLANHPVPSAPASYAGKTPPKAFPSNMVVTQKFSPAIKFLPLFLWSSFRQLANAYFLVGRAVKPI